MPITVSTVDRPNEVALRFLLDTPSKTVDISSLGANPILKLNVGTNGVYRVCYPIKALSQLMDNVEKLPALDRLGLANDMFALVRHALANPCLLSSPGRTFCFFVVSRRERGACQRPMFFSNRFASEATRTTRCGRASPPVSPRSAS